MNNDEFYRELGRLQGIRECISDVNGCRFSIGAWIFGLVSRSKLSGLVDKWLAEHERAIKAMNTEQRK